MKSVYIHIPFCSSICSYCDFCKFLHYDSWAEKYLTKLDEEIDKYYDLDTIRTVYIGGGTPSVLSMDNLEKLLISCKKFNLEKFYEFTFEMNVNDINRDKLDLLKRYGVNRISVGVQSFDQYNLKYLNRKHSKKDIFDNISLVKEYFDNVNVDIMYALPIESFSTLQSDIRHILKLDVEHISTYSLIIEQGTVLGIRNTKPIEEDLDYKMYKYICKTLKRKGYHHYEVSNFAKVGYESIHNMNYWLNNEYYSFGLGAHGFISELRYENTRSFNTYLKGEFRFNELILSKKEDMENEVILGLRMLDGIDLKKFFDKYNENIQDVFNINPLIKSGYLIIKNEKLCIKENYIYIMNEILNKILK